MNLEESFFLGKLPQFMPSAGPSATTADAAEFVDQTWVYGQNQYPGGCNPNYSYSFAVRACLGRLHRERDRRRGGRRGPHVRL